MGYGSVCGMLAPRCKASFALMGVDYWFYERSWFEIWKNLLASKSFDLKWSSLYGTVYLCSHADLFLGSYKLHIFVKCILLLLLIIAFKTKIIRWNELGLTYNTIKLLTYGCLLYILIMCKGFDYSFNYPFVWCSAPFSFSLPLLRYKCRAKVEVFCYVVTYSEMT